MSAKSKKNETIGSHCLIFWLPKHEEEGTSSIVKTDMIPRTKRKIGCTTKLWWNNENNKKRSYPVKILQFGKSLLL